MERGPADDYPPQPLTGKAASTSGLSWRRVDHRFKNVRLESPTQHAESVRHVARTIIKSCLRQFASCRLARLAARGKSHRGAKNGGCHQFAPRHGPRKKALSLKRIGWLYPIFRDLHFYHGLLAVIAGLVVTFGNLWAAGPPAQRIVSSAPSITEMLYALDLGDRVVGVTTFCHYPPEVLSKPKIGTYTNPNFEVILEKKPDLVVVLKEHRGTGREAAKIRLAGACSSTQYAGRDL